jgi:hypothetical protein
MSVTAYLTPATRRTIDRLALRAHAFHRYAHHPLCGRYSGELVTLGRRTRLCRGCLAVALGAVSGLLVGAVLPSHPATPVVLLSLGALCGAASLRLRLPKVVGRFAPALAGAASLSAALAQRSTAVAVAVLAVLGVLSVLYRRRRPDRSPCTTCPELGRPGPCSGFAPIVRRERAFQRVAERLIDRDLGALPGLSLASERRALRPRSGAARSAAFGTNS